MPPGVLMFKMQHKKQAAFSQMYLVMIAGVHCRVLCSTLAPYILAGSATTRPAPPLAPQPPTSSAVSSSSFKLSWASPQARGAPVTEYMVSVQQPATTADSNSSRMLAGAASAAMANGHATAIGNGALDSMDDASSTSGSIAHAQAS